MAMDYVMWAKIDGVIGLVCQLLSVLFFLVGEYSGKVCVEVTATSGGSSFGSYQCVENGENGNNIDQSEVVFGDADQTPERDGSGPMIVAFIFAILAFLLCVGGVACVFMKKYKPAMSLFGVALIGNCLFWIYMIPADVVDEGNLKMTVEPAAGWGVGPNIAAFCNILFALYFSKKLSDPKIATGGAPPAVDDLESK